MKFDIKTIVNGKDHCIELEASGARLNSIFNTEFKHCKTMILRNPLLDHALEIVGDNWEGQVTLVITPCDDESRQAISFIWDDACDKDRQNHNEIKHSTGFTMENLRNHT